jgi:murein L,D-transpeptidase YafK
MFLTASHRKAMLSASWITRLAIMCAAACLCSASYANESNTITESSADQIADGGVLMADRIVVRKSERRLYLMRNGQMLKTFRVALGLNPQGHKEREGDFRTPEGSYRLVRRNPRSDFFLSLQVSYPNDRDLAHAQRMGVKPGGAIMLHGWPTVPRKNPEYYASADWTDGCIAVTNSDMVEIWLRTPVDTPIDIYP